MLILLQDSEAGRVNMEERQDQAQNHTHPLGHGCEISVLRFRLQFGDEFFLFRDVQLFVFEDVVASHNSSPYEVRT